MAPSKNRALSWALIAAAVFLVGCATTKPAAPPEPVPEPPPPAVEPAPPPPAAPSISAEELDKLLADAQGLKKRAFDLALFEVLPDDYKSAEEAYAIGFEAYQAKEAEKAKSGLETAIAKYEDLIARGIVALAADKRKNAQAMRDTALAAGADSAAPERFAPAGEYFATADGLVADSKHEEAIAVFERSRVAFELAYKRTLAAQARERIADADYAKWDSGNYQLAENKYQAEDGLWAAGTDADLAAGIDVLDEAVLRFNLVIQKGRQSAALDTKGRTDDSKARSEEIKAEVAVKDLYAEALAAYEEGEARLAAGEYEAALDALATAGEGFDRAYEEAAAKRAVAEAAMAAATDALTASAKRASDADSLVNPQAGR